MEITAKPTLYTNIRNFLVVTKKELTGLNRVKFIKFVDKNGVWYFLCRGIGRIGGLVELGGIVGRHEVLYLCS